jgi:RNA polymerase sigma-70 factor (ECF subfamily)
MAARRSTLSGLAALQCAVRQVQLVGAAAGSDDPTGPWLLSVTTGSRGAGSATTGPGAGGSGYAPYGRDASGDDPDLERVAALVSLAQRGDNEAFAQLYDRYVDSIYRYLHYRVGTHALAEDLTSETFLRALRRLDTFTWQGRDFGAWLATIARNLVIDHHKSSRFRLEVPTGDILDADHADEDGDVEKAALRRLEDATLIDALREIKPAQQECVVLRFLEGFSSAETARILGRSEGAVKQLQLRALRSLAKILAERAR